MLSLLSRRRYRESSLVDGARSGRVGGTRAGSECARARILSTHNLFCMRCVTCERDAECMYIYVSVHMSLSRL